MDAPETFLKPPISEALVDIQVALPSDVDLAKLESFQDLVRDRFPNKQQVIAHSFQWKLGTAQLDVAPNAVTGCLFSSPDKTKIVQPGLNSFTFNKLRPYGQWESFSSEAKELWEKYLNLAKPVNVKRIALRYINSIDLPLPIPDLDRYLTTAPKLLLGPSWGLSALFSQISVRNSSSPVTGVITQTFNPPPPESKVLSFILDIDVSFQFDVQPPDTEAIWSKINTLRDFKNGIFFSSITEETKKLFR